MEKARLRISLPHDDEDLKAGIFLSTENAFTLCYNIKNTSNTMQVIQNMLYYRRNGTEILGPTVI
jgi:hypothetical protein